MSFVLTAAFLASAAHVAAPFTGWDRAGMTASRPALSYSEEGHPRLVIMCDGTQTSIQVRGFVAAQRWPQPALAVKFGAVERSAAPNLMMIGDQTAYSFDFPISDDVLGALRNGQAVSAIYRGETLSFPAPPSAFRHEFAEKCGALVPEGMRKN